MSMFNMFSYAGEAKTKFYEAQDSFYSVMSGVKYLASYSNMGLGTTYVMGESVYKGTMSSLAGANLKLSLGAYGPGMIGQVSGVAQKAVQGTMVGMAVHPQIATAALVTVFNPQATVDIIKTGASLTLDATKCLGNLVAATTNAAMYVAGYDHVQQNLIGENSNNFQVIESNDFDGFEIK